MPRTIRQALGERIRRDPELQGFLGHFRLATGIPVEFVGPLGNRDDTSRNASALCAWMERGAEGCAECRRFQQTLLEAASQQSVTQVCAAGLCESAVPMRAGGSALGYLVIAGYQTGTPDDTRLAATVGALKSAGIDARPDEIAPLLQRVPVVSEERQSALIALLQVVVEHLTAKISDRLTTPESTLPPLIERACDIVHAEFSQPLSVPEIARRLGVSEGHLSRRFHHATGLRFVEYIARYRADRARELLQQSDRSVTEIAFASGFHSLSQFNRVFRAQFGLKPSELREPAAGAN